MKPFARYLGISFAVLGLVWPTAAMVPVVNDTWIDGDRSQPAGPVYSENGADADGDGDYESAWFGSSGTLSVVNGSPGTAPGILRGTVAPTSSASWTTYFKPDASTVKLVDVGNQLRITWVFTPTGVAAQNANQSLRLAVVNWPEAGAGSLARLAADGNPGGAAYAGYAMFMNMGATLGHSNPFQLMEWNVASGTAAALLSASGSWVSRDDEESSGLAGYAAGTSYTFLLSMTRNVADGLDIYASMAGGTLGDDGSLEVSYTDATPNSFEFDTFSLRPSRADQSASQFDTTLFQVVFIPEPSVGALILGGGGLMLSLRRSRRIKA